MYVGQHQSTTSSISARPFDAPRRRMQSRAALFTVNTLNAGDIITFKTRARHVSPS